MAYGQRQPRSWPLVRSVRLLDRQPLHAEGTELRVEELARWRVPYNGHLCLVVSLYEQKACIPDQARLSMTCSISVARGTTCTFRCSVCRRVASTVDLIRGVVHNRGASVLLIAAPLFFVPITKYTKYGPCRVVGLTTVLYTHRLVFSEATSPNPSLQIPSLQHSC